MKLTAIYALLVKGQSIEQIKEALRQKDTYSGEEVIEFLEAVVKRIDDLEAKLGIVGEINEENLAKIKEELKQKAGNIGSIKFPKTWDEYHLLIEKADTLEKFDKLSEAGELYLLCDLYYTVRGSTPNGLFSSFYSRQKKRLNARIFDKYEHLLEGINTNDNVKIARCLMYFYSERANAYEQSGDKESAEKDRKELQKILEKI